MSKSFASFFSFAVVFALPLMLVACDRAGQDLSELFGGNVPQQVLNEPRPVPSPPAVPEGQQTVWPQLGAAPLRPKDFTPQPVVDAAKKQMERDRDAGRDLQQDYQHAPPALPAAAPEN